VIPPIFCRGFLTKQSRQRGRPDTESSGFAKGLLEEVPPGNV
jgi:hypothetical protein